MLYYQIRITTINRKVHCEIREIENNDINAVWRQYELKAKDVYGNDLRQFDCKMLSKLSPEVHKHIFKKGKKDFKAYWLQIVLPAKSLKEHYNPKTTMGERAKGNDKTE